MGDCRICGKPAGLLRRVHPECEALRRQESVRADEEQKEASAKIVRLVGSGLRVSGSGEWFASTAGEFSSKYKLSDAQFNSAVEIGIHTLLDEALDDHLLEQRELDRIVELCDAFGFDEPKRISSGLQARLVKTLILSDLSQGRATERVHVSDDFPILMKRDERLLWVFTNASCHEQKIRTEYFGRSGGVSVRVAKGVYVRLGASKGERVLTPEMIFAGTGILAISNQHVHFNSPTKSERIPHRKIISVKQYSDGVEIIKDGATPKPIVFLVDDPWFASNVISKA